MTMDGLNEEYLDFVLSNFSAEAAGWEDMKRYLKNCTAISNEGLHLDACYIPKMFTKLAMDALKKASSTLYGILEKVTARYMATAEYRALFPFSTELESLILKDAGYGVTIPVMRADIFFNEDDFSFKFCEINTDGASAMNENRELVNAIRHTPAYHEFKKRYNLQPFELFSSFVEMFLSVYRDYSGSEKLPHVAIVDFTESGIKREFQIFKRAFIDHGVDATIAEIRKLQYKNGELKTPDGFKIDAVYRRAVTSECMEKCAEIKPFIEAVKDGAVCLIGAFKTQVAHNKELFIVLRDEATKSFLSEEENAFVEAHVPLTYRLNERTLEETDILKNKDKWLIKPADRYGSKGVLAGASTDIKTWQTEVLSAKGFVAQEYCPPHKTKNIFFEKGEAIVESYNNMTGLYMYAGKLTGLYSRLYRPLVTSDADDGRVAPSFTVADPSKPEKK